MLNAIPGFLIHGRYGVSSPLQTAWELSQRWTTSRLCVLREAGHAGTDEVVEAVAQGLTFVTGEAS
jgi:proline iminopeptidase